MTELEKQLLDVARSILADDMLPLLPAEYVAKVRSAIAAAEAKATSVKPAPNFPAVPDGWATLAAAPQATAEDSSVVQQAPAAPEEWRDVAGKVYRFMQDTGEHGVTCAIYDLDEDGKHIKCSCGMDEALRSLNTLLAAAPVPAQQAPGKWQPISTAPKNGMHILCYMETDFGGHMEPMYWSDGCWSYCLDGDYCQYTPSHWMPAPPAPTQEAGARLAAEEQEGGE